MQESSPGEHTASRSEGSSRRSLLLNSSYEPMKIVNWQRALILWFQDKVEVLEFHNIYIKSVKTSFQLPSVIRLKSYVRRRQDIGVRFCRENVYLRDKHCCQYCGKRFSTKQLTLDHVIPASLAGPLSWTNVVAACRMCNQKKSNKTPEKAGMPLLNTPTVPKWLPSTELILKTGQCPQSWLQYLNQKATA